MFEKQCSIVWMLRSGPIVEILFYLPVANGRMERAFFNSQLKLITNNQRTCLWEDTLDHDQLLRIKVELIKALHCLTRILLLLVLWNCGTWRKLET